MSCNQVRFGFLIKGYIDSSRVPIYNLRILKNSLSSNAALFSQGMMMGCFIMYRISYTLRFGLMIISSIAVIKLQFKNLRI